MIWDSPGFFWLLLLMPVIYGLTWYAAYRTRKMRERYFSGPLFVQLQTQRWETGIKFKEGFFYGGFFFLIVALAGPKIGTEVREVQREQLDLIVALDLSLSMKAEDVRPNRLEKARFEISRMLDRLHNDRIGLIVFSGRAMLHCPLTNDYSAFRMFLDIAEPDLMPSTSTDFQPMFMEAMKAFDSSRRDGADASRVLLIFSDGEDHFDRFGESLRELINMGVYIFSVGIGTEEGGRIRTTHPDTGAFVDFHRNREGRIVTTRLIPESLREIAAMSGGQYYQISRTAHTIEGFVRQLEQLERSTFAVEEITRYQNRFYFPAILSLFCFVSMMLIPGYKIPVPAKKKEQRLI
ncbi:MAG: VWA domain-containing protein [Balneolales bacterium]